MKISMENSLGVEYSITWTPSFEHQLKQMCDADAVLECYKLLVYQCVQTANLKIEDNPDQIDYTLQAEIKFDSVTTSDHNRYTALYYVFGPHRILARTFINKVELTPAVLKD